MAENLELRQRLAKTAVEERGRPKKPLEDITPRHLNNVGDQITADIRKGRDCKDIYRGHSL
jgi:hypothetical protein